MKLTVTKESLLEALQRVQNVVAVRTTIPVLANVLIKADEEGLSFTTTDLEVSVRCRAEATIEKNGVTTLPVKKLVSIVRELPDKEISLDVDDNHVTTLKCEAAFFNINGLSPEEFPTLPTSEGKSTYAIDQGAFREMLRKTSYAASSDETRYVLNGVLLSFKSGKLTMVATDGRRLALVEYEVEFPKEAEVDAIVPTKAVNELLHTLKDEGALKIHASANQIVFEFDGVMVSSKLIDGTYPNFRQVIPSECEERVAIERETLLSALKRVSLLASERSTATKLHFTKNKLTISSDSPDYGKARETLPLKYSGKELKIAFNPDYVMDALRSLGNDEVFFEFTDDMSPGVLKCDIPFLYVLMPMRLND
jgi:DNA polymerase III subunit beta